MSMSQPQLPVAQAVHPIHTAPAGTPRVRTNMDYWLRSYITTANWLLGIIAALLLVIVSFMAVNEIRYHKARAEAEEAIKIFREIMKDI